MKRYLYQLAMVGCLAALPVTGMAGIDVVDLIGTDIENDVCNNGVGPPDDDCIASGPPGPGDGKAKPERGRGILNIVRKVVAGNPVTPIHQLKIEQRSDATITFPRGLSLPFDRMYSSGRFIHTTTGGINAATSSVGYSWGFNLDTKIYTENGSDRLLVVLPSLRTTIFEPVQGEGNKWTSRPALGLLATAEFDEAESVFLLEFPTREQLVYNYLGNLVELRNPQGGIIYFERETVDGIQRIKEITTNTGDPRYVTLEYHTQQAELLTRIVLRNADQPSFSQELVAYEYNSEWVLEKVTHEGLDHGEIYRYGTFNPEGTENFGFEPMSIAQNPVERTLAGVSSWSAEVGEVLKTAYSYQPGGINHNGFARAEVKQAFSSGHLMMAAEGFGGGEPPEMAYPAPEAESRFRMAKPSEEPDSTWAAGGGYGTRIYAGDAGGEFTDFIGHWNRDVVARMHSGSYANRNHHNILFGNLNDPEDPSFTGRVAYHARGDVILDVQFDENGVPIVDVDPGVSMTRYVYQHEFEHMDVSFLGKFNIINVVDERGRASGSQYHEHWNKPVVTHDPFGRATFFEYDENHGQITEVSNNYNDQVTTFTYHPTSNQLETVTSNTGGTTTFTYYENGFGPLHTITDSLTGRVTTYEYHPSGQVSKILSNDGPDVEFWYDGMRVTERIVDGTFFTVYTYDDHGRLKTITDPNSNVTEYFYNGLGQRIGILDAEGGYQHFEYDRYGNLTDYTDGEGSAVRYKYDAVNRVIRETLDPEGLNELVTYYEYDGDSCGSCGGSGELSRIIDPRGQVRAFEFDAFSRLSSYKEFQSETDYPETPSRVVDYEYTHEVELLGGTTPLLVPTDLVTKIIDSGLPLAGQSFEFEYDNQLRLLKSFHPEGYHEEYFYDNFDRQEARRDVDGGIHEFSFDADGLLEGITDPNGLAIAYLYNIGATLPDPTAPRGALLEVEHANGTRVEYGYDSLNRLDSLVNRSSLGSVMSSFGYTYDDVGNITRIDLTGGDAWVYLYDDVYQLTREERRNPSDAVRWHRAYEYDDAGNRVQHTHSDMSVLREYGYSYNSLNQLVSLDYSFEGSPVGTTSFAYDENGNREKIIGPSGTLDLDWSVDDRLESVSDGTDAVEYAYDHMGQRILRRAHDGIRTRYFFAGLTEEIVKTSVPGVHSDNAFALEVAIEAGDDTAWSQGVGSGATISSVYDEERRKDVTHFLQPAMDCHQRFDAPITSTTKRVISLWHRRDWDCGQIVVSVQTTNGSARVNYRRDAGTDWVDTSGATWSYYVHLDLPTGEWSRVEQDIAADIQHLTPAVQYQSAHSVWLWGRDFRIDDIRFSNSMTTERNSLLPGSIGQVAYRERWEGTGGSPTPTYGGSARGGGERRWNSYNHIGNVVGTSDANGYFVEAVDTDAFGNPLASTQTGEWAGGLGGNRGLTTKELDPAAGLYYFYQRWYDPQTATFASRAPYPPDVEHAYGYVEGSPVNHVDPTGRIRICCRPVTGTAGYAYHCYFEEADGRTLSVFSDTHEGRRVSRVWRNHESDVDHGEKVCGGDLEEQNPCVSECVLEESAKYGMSAYQYETLGRNSNTFVRDVAEECGIDTVGSDAWPSVRSPGRHYRGP